LLSKFHPVTVIIPAFNEQKGIGGVLSVICKTGVFDECVIVDDGSKDQTYEIARNYVELDTRLRIIQHPINLGKGQAIETGLKSTSAPIIMTIDADLNGLYPQHLMDLAEPVLENNVDMAIAVFRKGRWNTDLSHHIMPWLSGQRCILREKLDSISWNAAKGYGFEAAITIASKKYGWRVEKVCWKGVYHPPSEGHRGLVRGIGNRGKMYAQIFRSIYISELTNTSLDDQKQDSQ
jgi:glycosyltransferase involved in cell wall biosynthesis